VTEVALEVAEKGDDGRPRRVYYLRGVGTARGERIRGGAFGVGLSRNVKGACRTIVENYDPGGERFFFGVSRGSLHRAEHGRPGPQRGALERQHTSRTDEAYRLVPPPAIRALRDLTRYRMDPLAARTALPRRSRGPRRLDPAGQALRLLRRRQSPEGCSRDRCRRRPSQDLRVSFP
jgi:hypothetical protein